MRHGSQHAGNLPMRFSLLLVFALVTTLSACSFASSPRVTAEQPATPSPMSMSSPTSAAGSTTSNPPTTPTQAPSSVTNCSQVAGFASAGSVSAGSHFSEVSFHANTVGFIAQKFETNDFQFEIINACTQSTTASAIRTYYASGLTSSGFVRSSTFPYHGNARSACGDPYCWYKDGSHPSYQARRYVSLESVVTNGSVVTYSLRLSIAPIVRTGVIIRGTYPYDFDLVSRSDVWWEQVTSTERRMVPENGATIANIGVTNFTNVTAAQLKGTSYSTSSLNGNNDSSNQLVNGDVWAVHTSFGCYVKVLVTSYGYNMTVTYVWYEYTF